MHLLAHATSPIREQLSSIFGSISFSCWLILMIPQLVEQWRLKTVDGISPIFLLIWATGDVFNVIGAIWAHLLPEVILIALWFVVADVITFAFYFYISQVYDKKRHNHRKHHPVVLDEQTTLLGEHAIHDIHPDVEDSINYASTDEQHHHHHHHHHHRRKSSTLEDVVYEPENHSVFVRIILPLLLVIAAGVFGSILSPNKSTPDVPENPPSQGDDLLGPQILGYLCAAFYLTARLPQIYHNYKKKSTAGLSLLFFLLTMLGNITYSLQILVYKRDREYLLLNLSWLLGSLGTIIEDIVILTQFYLYRNSIC
ncbi:hypothetical protein CANINC_001103 [Pichia inconspicua]|uniref:Uncharacterized protein n=1 Tax=Pichia inconspicua TaxID=52247 RepID=A0A4T0X4F4_9ASCO|nr:hypothetical protein CANINC_001103 [[Candida] inconspicua]